VNYCVLPNNFDEKSQILSNKKLLGRLGTKNRRQFANPFHVFVNTMDLLI